MTDSTAEEPNQYSPKHPHEPEVAPVFDKLGRCLICVELGLKADVEQAGAQREEAVGLIYSGGHGIGDLCCAPRNASVPRKAKGCQQCTFLAGLEKGSTND